MKLSRFRLLSLLSLLIVGALLVGPFIELFADTPEDDMLRTVHPDLQLLFTTVRKTYPLQILEGYRNAAKQEEVYRKGWSKLRWPRSKHNTKPSLAIDVAPLPVNFEDKEKFYHFAGYVKSTADSLKIPVRWGGDWDSDGDFKDQTFMDLVHWELVL